MGNSNPGFEIHPSRKNPYRVSGFSPVLESSPIRIPLHRFATFSLSLVCSIYLNPTSDESGNQHRALAEYRHPIYLWIATVEDTALFLMSWVAPDPWFHYFHNSTSASLDVAWLRRSGDQWAAFALAQAIALVRWRQKPVWLVIVAGVRVSDLFTDISYILAVPSLTTLGWALLLPPPVLDLVGVVILLWGYRKYGSMGFRSPA